MLLLLGLTGWYASRVGFNNDRWLPPEHPVQQAQDYLQAEFESGQDLLLIFDLEKDAYFNSYFLAQLEGMTDQLAELPDVSKVQTPLHATTILNAGDELRVESFAKALEKGHLKDLAHYRQDLTQSAYYGRLISPDFRVMNMVVSILSGEGEDSYQAARARVLKAVRGIEYPLLGQPRFAGEAWLYYTLDKKGARNLAQTIPILIVLIALLLGYLFRNVARTLIVLTSGALSFLLACAIVAWQGHDLTIVSISLPVLIWVIAIADSIHIVSHWDNASSKYDHAWVVLKETIKNTWRPCLMTTITTAVGFASFSFSSVLPLRYLGQDSFIAVFAAYLVIVLTNWLGLFIFCAPRAEQSRSFKSINVRPLADFCLGLATRFSGRVILVWGLLGLVSLLALAFIRFETNLLDVFFKKSSPTYQNFVHVDKHLGGSGSIDLMFRTPDEDYFKNPAVLREMAQLEETLSKDPHINHAISYRESVDLMFRRLTKNDQAQLPQTPAELGQTLLFLEFSRGAQNDDVLSPYVDFVYANARTHLQTPNLNSSQIEALVKRIKQSLLQFSLPAISWAGSQYLFQSLSREILTAQVVTVLTTMGFIYLMFLASFGWKLGSIGMLANILPVLMTTGLISLTAIPFDFATVLIASISFGICVDDTIHSLHYFKHIKRSATDANLRQTLHRLMKPLLFTSLLFGVGFSVFIFSDFVILIKFGAFSLFAIITALLADVIFLPACLRLFYLSKN